MEQMPIEIDNVYGDIPSERYLSIATLYVISEYPLRQNGYDVFTYHVW